MPAAEEATVKHAPLDVVVKGVLSVLSRLPEGVQRRTAGDLAVEHGTDKALGELPPSSKLLADRHFLLSLRDKGREAASEWIERHLAKVGDRSSFNYNRLVSQLTQESDEQPDPRVLREDG